ncbi:MAG: hypothetical protein AB8H79_25330 [Myxococcota bacterium]
MRAFALLMLLTPALAQAQPPHHRPGPPPPPHEILQAHAAELGIDAQTIAQAKEIADDARPDMEALHEQARASHDAVRERHEQVMQEVMELLTPEQQTQLEALMPKPPPRRGPPPRR